MWVEYGVERVGKFGEVVSRVGRVWCGKLGYGMVWRV